MSYLDDYEEQGRERERIEAQVQKESDLGKPDEVIAVRTYQSAEEFLAQLNPAHPRWHTPDPRTWIYRGHGDSEWFLSAKAYRPNNPYEPFGVACEVTDKEPAWCTYGDAELALLDRFREQLDRAGLPVPQPLPDIRYRATSGYSGEWPESALPLVALAQHFGLPTTLLDWTRQARFAAYFAAVHHVTAKDRSTRGALAVWAMRTDLVEHLGERRVDGTILTLATAPGSGNPNLHAQQGLFTRSRGENPHTAQVDHFVREAIEKHGRGGIEGPLMWKIEVGDFYAPHVLRFLAFEGVTGATMFPGYGGIVQAMKEEAWWKERV